MSETLHIDASKWEKIAATGLDAAKIDQLIAACAAAHSEYISVGLACGIRAAFRMLGEMGGDRAKPTVDKVSVKANGCVAIAFMVITCANPCQGGMDFVEDRAPDWRVCGSNARRRVEIKMQDAFFANADAVFAAADSQLFASVSVTDLAQ